MFEACLICEGKGGACRYCGGSGKVAVRALGDREVLVATGSCKVPAKKIKLEAGLVVERNFTKA